MMFFFSRIGLIKLQEQLSCINTMFLHKHFRSLNFLKSVFRNMVCARTDVLGSSRITLDASARARKFTSHRENKFAGDAGV